MDEVKDTNPVPTDSTAPEQTTTPEPVPTPTDEAAPQGGTILTPPAEPVPTPERLRKPMTSRAPCQKAIA